MIDRFADWFAGVLLEKGVITEDELEVQVYGIQTILSNLLSYGVVLAVSWAFGVLPLSAVFLAVYTVLRKTVGGWHAKTPFSCALSSIAARGCCLRPLPQRALHCCLQRGRRDAWRFGARPLASCRMKRTHWNCGESCGCVRPWCVRWFWVPLC